MMQDMELEAWISPTKEQLLLKHRVNIPIKLMPQTATCDENEAKGANNDEKHD